MEAHRLEREIPAPGQFVLSGLPLAPGHQVEIVAKPAMDSPSPELQFYCGVPIKYIDPCEPALPFSDWDMYK